MKRIVICCDGTWNHLGMVSPTNVVKTVQALKPISSEGIEQLVYYDEGVGTQTGNWFSNVSEKVIGGAFGHGLEQNVQQAYRFIANNYNQGDDIFLFGFSRGAYTVRSVAGLIGCIGLLTRANIIKTEAAYTLYKGKPSEQQRAQFKSQYSTKEIKIKALCCWDTVGALGIPDKLPFIDFDKISKKKFRFIDDVIGSHIENAFHALALHEQRKEFTHTPMLKHPNAPEQNVKQMWFSGDHSCIGGGSEHKKPLANIALNWMFDQVAELNLELDKSIVAIDTIHPLWYLSYFNPSDAFIYGDGKRRVEATENIHQTALQRFKDLSEKPLLHPVTAKHLFQKAANVETQIHNKNVWKTLSPNESTIVLIHSNEYLNNGTYLKVARSEQYQIETAPQCQWQDKELFCNADGWNLDIDNFADQIQGLTGELKKQFIAMGRKSRIMKDENWFKLCVCDDKNPLEAHSTAIGLSKQINITHDHKLYAYANDAKLFVGDFYGNNKGWLPVKITRLC